LVGLAGSGAGSGGRHISSNGKDSNIDTPTHPLLLLHLAGALLCLLLHEGMLRLS
jgi:hypothetical protein